MVSVQLRFALPFALCLAAASGTVAHATDRQAADAAPPLQHYSLLLPYNLPHLMQAMKGRSTELGIDDEQKHSLAGLVFEIRAMLQPRFEEAAALEQDIARAALDGQTKEQLAGQLDRLQELKRESAEIHIDCVNRVRNALSPEQYAHLLTWAAMR